MRAQDPGKATDPAAPRRSAPRVAPVTETAPPVPAAPGPALLGRAGTTPAAMYALQRSVGNAAAARVVRREEHRHTAECGHGPQGRPSAGQIQRDAVRGVLGSRGRSLPVPVQREAEGRLKVPEGSYRSVEIHDSPKDLAVARALGAVAFTSGKKIVGDVSSKKTLLHELIHVGQQQRGRCPEPTAETV